MKHCIKYIAVFCGIATALFTTTAPTAVKSQNGTTLWSIQTGSTEDDHSESIACDTQGNIYVCGTTEGRFFSTSPYTGEAQVFIAKYDANGNQLWGKQFGDALGQDSPAIAVDNQNNLFVTGGTNGSLFGTNSVGGDYFLAKYDTNGNQLWAIQKGVGNINTADGIAVGPDGNITIVGYTNTNLFGQNADAGSNATPGEDVFVARYDTNGNLLWGKQFGAPGDDMPGNVVLDHLENVIIVGVTHSLFGPNLGSTDIFLAKLDSNGNLIWGKQFGTANVDDGSDVRIDNSNNIYIAGTLNGSENGLGYGVVAKYDPNGNQIWSLTLNTGTDDEALGIGLDNQSNVYVVGDSKGNLFAPNAGGTDAYIAKYDTNGNLIWGKQNGTSSADNAVCICVDSTSNNVYVSGDTAGSLFAPNLGGNDFFLQKISPSGQTAKAKPRHLSPYKPLLFAWSGQTIPLSYPPVLANKQPYVFAGYLCSGIPGAKVQHLAAGRIAVLGRSKQVVIDPRSRTYQINGKAHTMSAKPVLVDGQCYVPLDVMKAVLPYPVSYEAKARRVRFDPPQKKVARR